MAENPEVLHPPGKWSPLMREFTHLTRNENKYNNSRENSRCYRVAKTIGDEARKQAILLAVQTVDHVTEQVYQKKGIYLHTSEGILQLLEEYGKEHVRMIRELEQLI